MPLAWVQHHLGFDAKMLERSIQAFGLPDGVGRVFFSIENQGGGAGIANISCGGVAGVDIWVFPGRTEIPFVAFWAFLGFEFGLLIEDRSPCDCSLESVGLGNCPRAHLAAIGPTTDAESIGVRFACGDDAV